MINEEHIVKISLENKIEYKIYLPLKESDYISKSIYESKKPYEYEMLKDMLDRMNENEVFIDIGANLGNHSLFMAAHGFKVYAFEPNEELCKMLETSIKLNGFEERIILHKIALGEGEARAKFKEQMPHNLGGQSLELTAEQRGGGIEVKALDTFEIKEKIGIIKIDVEGMESAVLKGAREIIQRDKPLLYVEVADQGAFVKVNHLLDNNNYLANEIFNATPTILCMHKKSLNERQILEKLCALQIWSHYFERFAYTNTSTLLKQNKDEIKKTKQELFAKNNELIKQESQNQDLLNELKNLRSKYLKLQNELKIQENNVQNLKKTLSFRVGNRIVTAKSFKKILSLPYHLYKDYKNFKAEKKPAQYISIQKNINFNPQIKSFERNFKSLKELKIACISDTFTYKCLKDECDLLYLDAFDYKIKLENFKPHLFFIESTWKGIDNSWNAKLTKDCKELDEIINYCKDKKIPTLFWNKEDPVDFGLFLHIAKKVDFVFTTDIEQISRYKAILGHANVYCMPFAAHTKFCNPLEKYTRKNAFCFAGSYYTRFKERQKDFEFLIDSIKTQYKIDIYDRNYGHNHSQNSYPLQYQKHIKGGLGFEEIDKAYKGYDFGININSITHSQTMFARRVFELMASNTLVVSNYSKALRIFFGDLIISSQDEKELLEKLELLQSDENYYKKLCLLALRKVIDEHTYSDRIAYLLSVIFKEDFSYKLPKIVVASVVKSVAEYEYICACFEKQDKKLNKSLLVINPLKLSLQEKEHTIIKQNYEEAKTYILNQNGYFALLNANDFYAPSYLLDLILATKYSNAKGYGKNSFYEYDHSLKYHQNAQYQKTKRLNIYSSIVDMQILNADLLERIFKKECEFYENANFITLDCFNYCKNGASMSEELKEQVSDLPKINTGKNVSEILELATKIKPNEKKILKTNDIFEYEMQKLFELFKHHTSSKFNFNFENNVLQIHSKLSKKECKILQANKDLSLEELNFLQNSKILFQGEYNTSIFQIFICFKDKEKNTISKSICFLNEITTLAIPVNAESININLLIEGNGKIVLENCFADNLSTPPSLMLNTSHTLVLTRQYPSYDDIYKFGFLHSRLKAYKKEGLAFDVFKLSDHLQNTNFEFEGIDVFQAKREVLFNTLANSNIKKVLVHFLDRDLWEILKHFVDKIQIIVWVHGYEIQTWQRRAFNLIGLDEKEVKRQKNLSAQRVEFWTKLIKENHKNLHFVFVSEYFKNESLSDLKLSLPKNAYSIIHNYINTELFTYVPKSADQRKKILSIRPFPQGRGEYANDLSVFAVLELSKRSFFDDLEFFIAGDGEFFDELTKPLRAFKNVKLQKAFFQQSEIAALHKEYGIFLVPTRMDSQGVSRDEAMSSGLVPVTNDVAAVSEFVDKECGFLCEAENAKALADAIEFLYFNPDQFLQMSANAAARVRRQSAYEHTIQKEIALIKGRVNE